MGKWVANFSRSKRSFVTFETTVYSMNSLCYTIDLARIAHKTQQCDKLRIIY
jgi:hypothetical protein